MTAKQSRRGFTLLEVLVVIAILLVVIAFLIPAQTGHGPSWSGRCRSNQQKISVGALMYAQDFRGRFPNLDSLPGNDGPVALMLLANYLKQTNVFMCPFSVKRREQDRPAFQGRFVPQLDAAFFRSNGNDYAYYDGGTNSSPTNAFLADRWAWTNRSKIDTAKLSHGKNRINAAFTDGHVQTLELNAVVGAEYTPPWSAVQDPVLRP